MGAPPVIHPLRRLFAGLTEHAFLNTFGLADPPLVDYLADLLSRFVHSDAIYRLRNSEGRQLQSIVEMLLEAQMMPPEGRTAREVHRHIGDFALFWTGIFPESLQRHRPAVVKDSFIDYTKQGKRSYFIASQFDDEQADILRRLSEHFEMCAYGLTQVRRDWQALQHEQPHGVLIR